MVKEADHKQLEVMLKGEQEPAFSAALRRALEPAPQLVEEPAQAEQIDPSLHAVAEALEQLDRAATLAETVALASETLIGNFPITGLALALREATGCGYQVTGLWGVPAEVGFIPADSIGVFLGRNRVKRTITFDGRMRSILPQLQAARCTFFPLRSQDDLLGFLAVVDTELGKGESMLVSMVAHASAGRLSRILKEAEQARANEMSGRLMSLANTLLLVDNKDDLYEAILRIASDLIQAAHGSIMLIDQGGKNLQMVCSRGASPDLAQSLPVRLGQGIAGTVADTGEPLLINEIEKELSVGAAGRPPFTSKSLVCVPLKLKEKVIGVLNLSDKSTLAPFSAADLHTLTSFANLASLMIERTLVLEESVRFEQLAVTDALTGLYNRRYLKSRLEEELSRSVRQGLNLTVLFMDLDLFKSYNDICGHLAGDEALKRTAELIKSSVREMDIVARYGGEEFCAVLPGTSKPEAMLVADRIRKEIENETFPVSGDLPLRRMTASLGVATFPEDGCTYTALMHASDMALYQAKAAGRNRIVAATAQPCQLPAPTGPVDYQNLQ
ncbi:MAG TPA: diguanylate cyclase [Geomonas sp.]|nr:diguanylate cyclase [Geomonas sp.]